MTRGHAATLWLVAAASCVLSACTTPLVFEFGGEPEEREEREADAESSTQVPGAEASSSPESVSSAIAMEADWDPFEFEPEPATEVRLEVDFEGWCTYSTYLVDAGEWYEDEQLHRILSEPIRLAQFTLRNESEVPVYFRGDRSLGPDYRVVPLEEQDPRNGLLPSRCGNGLVTYTLQPHGELALDVYTNDEFYSDEELGDFILELYPYREDWAPLETLRSEIVEASSER